MICTLYLNKAVRYISDERTNIMYYTNKIKDKNFIIILIDSKRAFNIANHLIVKYNFKKS